MSVPFLIYGTFMSEQPGHANLEGAEPLEAVRTAARYRLYRVDGRWPALVPDEEHGVELAAELYELDEAHVERLSLLEPAGWGRAPVELADGRRAEAFLADPALAQGAVDVSRDGGWAAAAAAFGGR